MAMACKVGLHHRCELACGCRVRDLCLVHCGCAEVTRRLALALLLLAAAWLVPFRDDAAKRYLPGLQQAQPLN